MTRRTLPLLTLLAALTVLPLLALPASAVSHAVTAAPGLAAWQVPDDTDTDADDDPDETDDADDGPVVAVSDASVLARDLGFGDTITLQRPAGRAEVDVLVADGLVFTAVSASLVVPSAVFQVQVDIAVDGTSIYSQLLDGGSNAELYVPLPTPLDDDALVTLTAEERFGATGTCTSSAVEPAAIRVNDLAFQFDRLDDRPGTIADFFPPVLEEVTVVVDDEANSSVRSAALELATALARRYPTMPAIEVEIADLPSTGTSTSGFHPPISDDPFARTIVLADSTVTEMTVVEGDDGNHLRIQGPPGLLEEMAAVVSEPELSFVTKRSATAEEFEVAEVTADLLGRRSLRDVGVRRLVASGSRVLQLPIDLPQAAFGEPIAQVTVRLGGVSIASNANGREPVLSFWLNGDLQDVIEVDSSGRFDLEFTIDPARIRRDNLVVLRSELALECGQELPSHELQLDAASWVDAEPGQALPPSLDRFPQAAIGHLAVATGSSGTELALAMATVGALQGASPLPIHPQVAPVDRILTGTEAGLVVTDGNGYVAEAMARDLTTVRTDSLAFVSGESPNDLAVLSTSSNRTNQDVLVVYVPDAEIGRVFADTIGERGWGAFTGTAVGVRGGGDVITAGASELAVPLSTLEALNEPEVEETSVARRFALGIGGAVLLVVVVGLGRFLVRLPRRLR